MRKILVKIFFFADKVLRWLKVPRGSFFVKANGVILRNLKTNFIVRHGLSVYLDYKDSLCLSLTEHEPGTINVFKNYVKPGETAWDLGANIGYLSLLLAKSVGLNGRVYSFEPDKENFRLLQKNIEVNRYKNIFAINKAVAEKDGKLKFYPNPTHPSGGKTGIGKGGIEVDGIALDNFPDKKVDFIKMDIEGGEYGALLGMEGILDENPNIKIIMEFCPTLNGSQIADFLAKHGFMLYETKKDGVVEINIDNLKNLTHKIDLFCKKFLVKS